MTEPRSAETPRRRTKRLMAFAILAVLLVLVGAAYTSYRSARSVDIALTGDDPDVLTMPRHLYSFAGEGDGRLVRPLGVLADDGRVYVTDARRGVLDVFTAQGRKLATWGKGKLVVPLYVARHPETRELWVTDRTLRAIAVFSATGEFVRYFDPKLPKNQIADSAAPGEKWAPLALAFAPDGTLYVTDILDSHRLLVFGPDGDFRRSVGTSGLVADASTGGAVFQFPNSVKVLGDEVWVADSNNRRIQVFNRQGVFRRVLVTEGLPRGFDFLPKRRDSEPLRLVVVDTLAHAVTIWESTDVRKVQSFGGQGVLEGQFNYPNDVSVDADRKIFVADSSNGRVEVWGWSAGGPATPRDDNSLRWLLWFLPLLLLPLLLLMRKRRYVATADFVNAMLASDEAGRMVQRGVRWEVTPVDYELLRNQVQGDVKMEELLHPVAYSHSEARALQERHGLQEQEAVVVAMALRGRLLCTENPELRRVAQALGIPNADHVEFVSRFAADDEEAGRASAR